MMYKSRRCHGSQWALLLLCLVPSLASGFDELPPGVGPGSNITTITDYRDPGRIQGQWFHGGIRIEWNEATEAGRSGASSVRPGQFRHWLETTLGRPLAYPEGILCGTDSGSVFWFDHKRAVYTFLFGVEGPVDHVEMDQTGSRVVAIAGGAAWLWNAQSPGRIIRLQGDEYTYGTKIGVERLSISPDGKTALLRLRLLNADDYVSLTYLIDLQDYRVKQRYEHDQFMSFAPNNAFIIWRGYDHGASGTVSGPRPVRLKVSDLQGAALVSYSVPAVEEASLQSIESKYKPRILLGYELGWNPFGLTILSPKSGSHESGYSYYVSYLLAGSDTLPDIGRFRTVADLKAHNNLQGLHVVPVDHFPGVYTVKRWQRQNDSILWTRMFKMYGVDPWWNSPMVVPEANMLVFPMGKERYDPESGQVRSQRLVRFFRWSDGREVRREISLDDFVGGLVSAVSPGLKHVVLGGSHPHISIVEPETGRLQDWKGTRFRIGGNYLEFKRSMGGSVSWTQDGVQRYMHPAEGQVGNVVDFSVSPETGLIVTTDEIQQVFLRELSSGAVRFRGTLKRYGNTTIAFSSALSKDLGAPASTPLTTATTVAPLEVKHVRVALPREDK